MVKKRVFVTRKIPDEGLRRITEKFDTIVWDSKEPPSIQEIVQNAEDCDGLVTLLSDPIGPDVINKLPKLKVIAQYAVGYDNIDVLLATKRKIAVTNTPGVLTETTADLTWALLMAASRRIAEADRYIREKKWDVAWGPELLLGTDIFGATLGIVGMGRIGQSVARRASGFNMKILYYSRTRNESIENELDVKHVDLHTLLRESDIVTLHIPLNSETHHLISKTEFELMKEDSILVNTSRGKVVDESALYNALKVGHIGSAGLDVFQEEPISKDSPLLDLHNIVISPHIGSASKNTRAVMSRMCAENLIAVLEGNVPPNIVNPEVL
ncbi:MAG: D-glycerate dehydrogenase [Candidatus Thorarchaeota archaeon]|nr:D-glycerate dehydrogenase [Candidatus Thorarchaeota archaeon]